MKIFSLFLSFLILSLGSLTAVVVNPWQFNVYTLNSIGTNSNNYSGAGFQGIVGAGTGGTYLSNISINSGGPPTDLSLYSNGTVRLSGGNIQNGGISAAGTVHTSNTSVSGNIFSGNNINLNSGNVQGNVTAAGNVSTPNTTVTGTIQQNTPFTSPINFGDYANFFLGASQFWGNITPTSSWTNTYGLISVNGLQSGRNVINLTAADLNAAWGISVSGPADAFLVINVVGSNVSSLKSVTMQYANGISNSNVLFNLPGATNNVVLNGSYVSVLAPLATLTYQSGLLTGNLVANNLLGSGSTATGAFAGFQIDQNNFITALPEPSTYILMGSFLLLAAMAVRAKKRRTVSTHL